MPTRLLHILITITRIAACTAVVPATLAASLLTVPVVCECGAGYPHPHPPFTSANHYHGPRPDDDTTTEAQRAANDGLSAQTTTGPQAASQPAVPALLTSIHIDSRQLAPQDARTIPDGRQDRPDVPPPRHIA